MVEKIIDDWQNKDGRNYLVDMLKGMAIILMILDHVLMKGRIITSFHMPVFFVLAGCYLRTDSVGDTIISKAKSLLVPYALIGSVTIIIGFFRLMMGYGYTANAAITVSLNRFYGLLVGEDVWLLWFFVVLFLAEIFYVILVNTIGRNNWIRWSVILLLNLIGYQLSCRFDSIPWRVDTALICICFVAVGCELKKYFQKMMHMIFPCVAGTLIWCFGLPHTKLVLSMGAYEGYPFCIIVALAGVLTAAYLCSFLYRFTIIRNFLTFFGKNTITVVAIQNICRQFMHWEQMVENVGYITMFVLQMIISCVAIIGINYLKKSLLYIKS